MREMRPIAEGGFRGRPAGRTAQAEPFAPLERDIEAALRRILTAAVELFDASYGAIVDDPPSDDWRTVHQHFSDEDLDRLRRGILAAGVLDRLLADGRPVIITGLPWTGTVATGAPVLVLAVPIQWDGRIGGGLVVAAAGRAPFTDDDARLLQALAAAAGIAVGSEALRSDLLRREAWSDASAEIVSAVLTGRLDDPLAVLSARVRTLARADCVCVLRGDGASEGLTVVARSGDDDGPQVGDRVPVRGSIVGDAVASHQPRVVSAGVLPLLDSSRTALGGGPMMVAPMLSAEVAIGAILVGRRPGGPAFSAADLDMLAGFVGHTTVALQLAEVRADRERIMLVEDRARIARDLHDTVIQQLFAAGLELRATAADVPVPRVHAGIDHGVMLIDGAIDRIRTAVLAISPEPAAASLRHRILDVVRDLSREFAQPPELRFDGPVELVARGDLGEDVVAVVREALTNVARHAAATHAGVRVSVLDGRIRVEVWDDGRGMPDSPPRSGLANLEDRAFRRGGEFTIGGRGITRAEWTVPYGGGGDE